jgi:hypothetical protein
LTEHRPARSQFSSSQVHDCVCARAVDRSEKEHTPRVPRKIRDLGLTLAALVIVFGMLVSINPHLRERTRLFLEDPQSDSLRDTLVNSVISGAIFAQGYADHHVYMVAFLIAACVFFVLMLKVIS